MSELLETVLPDFKAKSKIDLTCQVDHIGQVMREINYAYYGAPKGQTQSFFPFPIHCRCLTSGN